MEPAIARSAGKIRLDYSDNGRDLTKLWEPRQSGVLETTFNSDGAILAQQFLAIDGAEMERRMRSAAGSELPHARETSYAAVKLKRACPNCGSADMVRYTEAFSKEVPVMPMYYCNACKKQSFYLTDEYLGFLVDANPALFEGAELRQLEAGRESFVSELKEYIIRIFAAKHVARIR